MADDLEHKKKPNTSVNILDKQSKGLDVIWKN